MLVSYGEQCSYVVIEMMMHGLPIVATKSEGLNDMIRDTEAKIELTDDINRNITQLTECILNNLDRPDKKNNSRNSYLNNYTIEMMIEKTLESYNLSEN